MAQDQKKRKPVEGAIPVERYGRWTVLYETDRSHDNRRMFICKCDCGKEKKVYLKVLKNGISKSCGCLRKEIHTTHGFASNVGRRREYRIYDAMKSRCNNKKHRGYEKYGGAGVCVCDRWMECFENFIADMGPCPKGCSIDRFPNPDGNYEPSNCRWATNAQQARNKSSNINIEFDGITMCLADWAKWLGVRHNTLTYRIQKWNDVEKAFTTPFAKFPNRKRSKKEVA